MSKNLGEIINNIMKENTTKQVVILTQNLYILGTIHDYIDNCKNCHDCIIALKNAKVAKLDELCNCNINDCECSINSLIEYKWLNVTAHSIVAFSILGE